MSSRLEKLRELVEKDPQNAFVRYGLAQEMAGQGRLEEAVAQYRELLATHPEYCYAYFHCGRTLEKLGRAGEARDMYRSGMEAAARAGDQHARSELEAALAELKDDSVL